MVNSLKGDDTCRLKAGLRQIKGRWYCSVMIWDNEHCEGPPLDERIGPEGGLDTRTEALIYYHEKCRPIMEMLIADAEADGVEVETLIKPTLH